MIDFKTGNATLKQHENVRVLLVDDDRDEYQMIRAMLARMKPAYDVDWVASYEAALSTIREKPTYYDVYLIDYRLVGHSGLDLLREPIVSDHDIPAIVITNEADMQVDLDAMRAGAADYLNKNQIQTRMLERTIRYALERAAAVRQVRQSEARYRAIVSEHPDMIIRHNLNGEITFANSTYCRYRDVANERPLLGTYYLDPILPEHRDALHTDALRRSGNNTTTREVQAYTPDGRTGWQLWTTQVITNDGGSVLEYQSVIRDITDRKQVENALNQRLEQLSTLRHMDSELTETLDMSNVISLALDSAMRLSASDVTTIAIYDPDAGILDKIRSYGVPDLSSVREMYEQRKGIIGRVFESRQAEYIKDMSDDPGCVRSDPRMKSQMVIPLFSRDQFLGVVNVETKRPERFGEDVFDFLQLVTARIAVSIDNARLYDLRRRRLSEMESLYKQVSELEQLKTDMIQMASHDIRNPLGALMGHIQNIQRDLQKNAIKLDELTEKLEDMDSSAQRMLKIAEDILTLERFEQQGAVNDRIDMAALLRGVANEYQHAASEKQLNYQLNLPPHPTYIYGDKIQLEEAAGNLINNAIKYTPSGGEIDVMLENDGDAVIFEVIDTGPGIPYDMQQRLFQPFYRAKTRETANIGGSGLGLHLVKNIIQRHNGRVIFRSRYKEGSTFGFQIPTADDE